MEPVNINWADIILAACQMVFIGALVPMTRRRATRPPTSTCIPTTVALAITALTLLYLGLWFTALCAGLSCMLWGVVTLQALFYPLADNVP